MDMLSTGLPDPLSPEDCDLRGYDFMPILGHKLFTSELYLRGTGDEFRTATRLWWAAWNQKPAGSLPSDDASLAMLADYGRDIKAWLKVKSWALHGFVSCSDGRLYHPILACEAIKAYAGRLRHDAKRKVDFERLKRWRNAKSNPDGNDGGNGGETRFETPTETPEKRVRQGQRQGQGERKKEKEARGERGRAPSRAGARPPALIPDGWKPSEEVVAFGASLGFYPLDIDAAAEKMRDWVRSGGKIAGDWNARFRNWLRDDADRQRQAKQRKGWDQNPIGDMQREWNLPSFAMPKLDDDDTPFYAVARTIQ